MLTEESFHNNYGATSGDFGGKWKCVLATEDYNKDANGNTIYDANNIATPNFAASDDVVFTIGDVSAPGTPNNVKATPNSTDPTKVTVSWNPIEMASGTTAAFSTTKSSVQKRVAAPTRPSPGEPVTKATRLIQLHRASLMRRR